MAARVFKMHPTGGTRKDCGENSRRHFCYMLNMAIFLTNDVASKLPHFPQLFHLKEVRRFV